MLFTTCSAVAVGEQSPQSYPQFRFQPFAPERSQLAVLAGGRFAGVPPPTWVSFCLKEGPGASPLAFPPLQALRSTSVVSEAELWGEEARTLPPPPLPPTVCVFALGVPTGKCSSPPCDHPALGTEYLSSAKVLRLALRGGRGGGQGTSPTASVHGAPIPWRVVPRRIGHGACPLGYVGRGGTSGLLVALCLAKGGLALFQQAPLPAKNQASRTSAAARFKASDPFSWGRLQ